MYFASYLQPSAITGRISPPTSYNPTDDWSGWRRSVSGE